MLEQAKINPPRSALRARRRPAIARGYEGAVRRRWQVISLPDNKIMNM
jgi:hypothetical protein